MTLETQSHHHAKKLLQQLAEAAIAAARPDVRVPVVLPQAPEKAIIIGAGKASAAMARALELAWPETDLRGVVVTRYGYEVACERITIRAAAHPVPDAAGEMAAKEMLALAASAGADDFVVALMSGGASALLTAPVAGITLADKQAVSDALLRSGADISEMNAIRKHLSSVKGGRLAEAVFPARLLSVLISDVTGDDPAVIGSGPTVADPTTFADARAVVEKYNLSLPDAVRDHLWTSSDETPKPGHEIFSRSDVVFAARPRQSLDAAAVVAKAAGLQVHDLGDLIEGEAGDVGRQHADLALRIKAGDGPVVAPAVILSGGETTVTLRGQGRGGRNTEYLLGVAEGLAGAEGIYALAADTDGIDGSEDNAGAFIDPSTRARAEASGLSVSDALANNDAYTLFAALDDLLVTGPTNTNVNDFRAILVT